MTYYDSISDSYDELHGEEQRKKLQIIKEFIPKGAKILDVGSGTGLSSSLGDVTGIDPSIELLKQGEMSHVSGIGEHLPFQDHSFDVVISVTAIHHMDAGKAFEEMQRVGKDLFILTLLKKSPSYKAIRSAMSASFNIEREIDEEKDTIFICKKRKVYK